MLKRQSQPKMWMHVMHPGKKSSKQGNRVEYKQRSYRLKQPASQSQIVGVVILNVLRDPEDDRARSRIPWLARKHNFPSNEIESTKKHIPEHNKPISHNIRNSKVKCLDRIILDKVLENHNRLSRIIESVKPDLNASALTGK